MKYLYLFFRTRCHLIWWLGVLVWISGQRSQAATNSNPAEGTAAAGPRTIRSARQLLELNPEELKQSLPVEIQAVIVLFDPAFNLLFVHDGNACVYVLMPGGADFQRGQLFEIKGTAKAGQFAPFVAASRMKLLGTAPVPEPIEADLGQMAIGALDAQWIEVKGVVREAKLSSGQLRLSIAAGPVQFNAWVKRFGTNDLALLVHQKVRLRGVLAVKLNSAKQLDGFQVFLHATGDIQVMQSSLPSSDDRIRQVNSFLSYAARREYGQRVRVQGQVAVRWSETGFILRDETGAIEIECAEATTVMPGEVVEVRGYLAFQSCAVRLENTLVQKIRQADLPPAVLLRGAADWAASNQNQLLAMEATLLARSQPRSGIVVLHLRGDNRDFTAEFWTTNATQALAELRPGSRLRVTGLCRLILDRGSDANCPWCAGACSIDSKTKAADLTLQLWLRNTEDVQVLNLPARDWTPWLVVGICLGFAGLGTMALWNWFRRQLEFGRAAQTNMQLKLHEQERQLVRSFEERERMGRDLHDDIIQSMYALGLGLEDVRANYLRQSPDQADRRLSAATESLNQIMRNVRCFIGGLEPIILNGREFRTALKSLALTTGDHSVQIDFEVDPVAAAILTSNEATQLLRMAKEALSNSLRHARASHIMVSFKLVGHHLCLEIADNGTGFDLEGVKRPHGLRNLSSRAASIAATLDLVTRPGEGCRVIVRLPRKQTGSSFSSS